MLDEGVRRLTQGSHLGVLTFLLPDGSSINDVVWVDAADDHEHLLVRPETGRAKYRRLEGSNRVSVTILNEDDPFDYVEVSGIVEETLTGDEASTRLDSPGNKFMRGRYGNPIETERVTLKIRPTRQITQRALRTRQT